MSFIYRQPIPETCRDWHPSVFEESRLIDPALCREQIADLRRIVERLCATPSCKIDPSNIEILISDKIGDHVYIDRPPGYDYRRKRQPKYKPKQKKILLFIDRETFTECQSEDELAAAVAHELGHPENRKALGLEETPKDIPARIDETMADAWSAIFTVEAGYDWRALERLIQGYKPSPSVSHVFRPHGRKQERLKTVYDVLGARGIKTQTELREIEPTPLSQVYRQPEFLAAPHVTYLAAYEEVQGWNDRSPLQQLELLSEIPYRDLAYGPYRSSEYRRTVSRVVKTLEDVPEKILHGTANNIVNLLEVRPVADYQTTLGRDEKTAVRLYGSLAQFKARTPEDFIRFPPLGPYARVATALNGFMEAQTDVDIMRAARRLNLAVDRLEKTPSAWFLLKYEHIDFPRFAGSPDPLSYPWRKYDALLAASQSEILLRALWIAGASGDKLVWDRLKYDLMMKAYAWSEGAGERNYYGEVDKGPRIISHPAITGYRPIGARDSRPDVYRVPWDEAGPFYDEFKTHIGERILNERPPRLAARSIHSFSIEEIDADPIHFIKVFTDDVRQTNADIADYPDEWPTERKHVLHHARTSLFLEKVLQHIAAYPKAKEFWGAAIGGDVEKLGEENAKRLHDITNVENDTLAAFISVDKTAQIIPARKRLNFEEYVDRYVEITEPTLPLELPIAISPELLARYRDDLDYTYSDSEEKFDVNSPFVEFIIADPAGLLTAGQKLDIFSRYLKIKPFCDPIRLPWTRRALGYAKPRTVQELADLMLYLSEDENATIWRNVTDERWYLVKEMDLFFKDFDPRVFSSEMFVFLRTWNSLSDVREEDKCGLSDKIRKKIMQKLEQENDSFYACPTSTLIWLNAYFRGNNLYPREELADAIAEELINRIEGAEPGKSLFWAVKCIESSHPLLSTAARKIWIKSQARRLGYDDGAEKFKAGFAAVLKKLDKQKVGWSTQLDLIKDLAKACVIQPGVCLICEEHFEQKARRAGISIVHDIGLRGLGLVNERMQAEEQFREDLIDFLAHDTSADATEILANKIYSRTKWKSFLTRSLGFSSEAPNIKHMALASLRHRLNIIHGHFWGLPTDWRAGIFSQLVIPAQSLSKDSAGSWRAAVATVQDLLFPLHGEMTAEQRKWTRWYRLGTEFYIEACHPTERGPLLALMLGVAKRSNQAAVMDEVEGVRRLAYLLNSFDPAHRKFGQIIGTHPDMPPRYAEPFHNSTFMAQEPPRWESVLQTKASLPSTLADAITWWGPLLGFASFYGAHGIVHEGHARVISVEHKNAREAALKGYKRLDIVIRRMAEAEPQFREYAPIARDMVAQARELAFKETDIEHGRIQLALMQQAMDGQQFEVDGETYTRQVVPWLESGRGEGGRNFKLMPWAMGQRLQQIESCAERERVAIAELGMTAENIRRGIWDTDGHTGNRHINDRTIYVFDVGGVVKVERTPEEMLRLFSIVAQMRAATEADSSPGAVIVNAIRAAEQETGNRPQDLVQLNKTVVSLGGWLKAVGPQRGLKLGPSL